MFHLKILSISLKRVLKTKLKQNFRLLLEFKSQLLQKSINKKDPKMKTGFHEIYETYRNLVSALRKVNTFIEQNTLLVTGLALKILEKESKLKFQSKIELRFLDQFILATEPLQILQL